MRSISTHAEKKPECSVDNINRKNSIMDSFRSPGCVVESKKAAAYASTSPSVRAKPQAPSPKPTMTYNKKVNMCKE